MRDRTWAKNRAKRLVELKARAEQRCKWKVRDSMLRRAYGISVFQYNELARQQEYACRICGNVPNRLNTDHDHATGRVRGLLCFLCNRGLAHFRDDPELFRRAAEYVRSDFDARSLVVPRSNFLVELTERALHAGEPIRVKTKRSKNHTTKELVVMTAATWERLNGTAEQKNFATEPDETPPAGLSPFSSHDPGDK
ncbi:MAG TPA: endonuclease VII domain-containing protein [Gemmatimonadales bacterium]|nr:endonuclease VII domain-containing protein [Gemmatimonadales bacterium]